VATTALAANQSATWWVGTSVLLPIVLAGGFLLVRKLRRADMVLAFFAVAILADLVAAFAKGTPPGTSLHRILTDSPLFFFAFVMLTEPLTMPPTRGFQLGYAAIAGFLFNPYFHLGSLFFTPELALLVANAASFAVSPKVRQQLVLLERRPAGGAVYDFIFKPVTRFAFRPGQYMEWTAAVPGSDDRGNRRYFTLASSPTEDTVRMGVKFYQPSSTFKDALMRLEPGDSIIASQLAGDFTLPKDPAVKCAFIAGGIGVTPFRSMAKYLTDANERRDIVLLYASRTPEEFAYADVFTAASAVGFRTYYALTDPAAKPEGWGWPVGPITQEAIAQQVPDYTERLFYLSGPHAMVDYYASLLKGLGVRSSHIKMDYFPGFV